MSSQLELIKSLEEKLGRKLSESERMIYNEAYKLGKKTGVEDEKSRILNLIK